MGLVLNQIERLHAHVVPVGGIGLGVRNQIVDLTANNG